MADQKILAEVVGAHAVAGVEPGGTVELDPADVNIDALVSSGAVKLCKRKAGD